MHACVRDQVEETEVILKKKGYLCKNVKNNSQKISTRSTKQNPKLTKQNYLQMNRRTDLKK